MGRSRRSGETRERLLEAGAALFLEQGFHGTGLKAILDRVGVPKGSFYNYFASKEDFGAEVVRHFAALRDRAMDEELGRAERDALGALRGYLEGMARCHESEGFVGGCLVAHLGGEIEECDPCREALAEAARSWRRRFEELLARAQREGSVRTDLGAAELGDLLFDAWEGALIRARIERSAEPLRQCLARLLDDLFRP